MKTTNITKDDYIWLYDAIGYGNVSTIGAAYKKLLKFREEIQKGSKLKINSLQEDRLITTTVDYDNWVRDTFPIFCDDQLHPKFMKK